MPLAYLSRAGLREMVAQEPIEFDYQRSGKLIVYSDRAALEEAKALAAYQATLGAEQAVLDAKACVALEPSLAAMGSRIQGGVHTPSEDAGDCEKFCAGLDLLLAERYRVERLYHHDIGALRREGRRLRSVLTDRGEIEADLVVRRASAAAG